MVFDSVSALLELSGPVEGADRHVEDCGPDGDIGDQYRNLLRRQNGFFAFDQALQVFPSGRSEIGASVQSWNSTDLWGGEYGDMIEGHWFFAQDVFGVQFSIFEGAIVTFDPETADVSPFASSFQEWAAAVLADNGTAVGARLATRWLQRNGVLRDGQRLAPKVPFILGGRSRIEDLYAADAVQALKFYASLAIQVRDLPDGTPIIWSTESPPARSE
jgi:hypothetical protein